EGGGATRPDRPARSPPAPASCGRRPSASSPRSPSAHSGPRTAVRTDRWRATRSARGEGSHHWSVPAGPARRRLPAGRQGQSPAGRKGTGRRGESPAESGGGGAGGAGGAGAPPGHRPGGAGGSAGGGTGDQPGGKGAAGGGEA